MDTATGKRPALPFRILHLISFSCDKKEENEKANIFRKSNYCNFIFGNINIGLPFIPPINVTKKNYSIINGRKNLYNLPEVRYS